VFNLPQLSHVTSLFRDLHWLPVEARIRFKTMVLAYEAVNGTDPAYLQALVKSHTPSSSALLKYFSWMSGTAIAKSNFRLIIKV
jgi:hypothetical protein